MVTQRQRSAAKRNIRKARQVRRKGAQGRSRARGRSARGMGRET